MALEQFFSTRVDGHHADCGHRLANEPTDASSAEPIDIYAAVEASIKRVWGAQKISPDVELIGAEGAAMLAKAEQGFGRKLIDVGYRDPDFSVLANLSANSYVHAAFKNHKFSHELQALLVDERGKVRSFAQFKRAAAPLSGKYYDQWLQAEHQTALTTGRMAAKWQQFYRRKDVLPFLTYVTQEDARVRDSHRALNRITKHIDDPFWDVHFPPNGWRCRCNVLQNYGPEDDKGLRTSEAQHPPQFRHNPGKDGRFWAKGTEPYRPKCLDRQLASCDAEAWVEAAAAKNAEALKAMGYESAKFFPDGGGAIVHKDYDQVGVNPSTRASNIAHLSALSKNRPGFMVMPKPSSKPGVRNPDGTELTPDGKLLTWDVKEQGFVEGTKDQLSNLTGVVTRGVYSMLGYSIPQKDRPIRKVRNWQADN